MKYPCKKYSATATPCNGCNQEHKLSCYEECKHPHKKIEDHDGYDYFVCPDCDWHARIDPYDRGDEPEEEH